MEPVQLKPEEALPALRRSMLVDGLPIVLDLEASRGCELVDAVTGDRYLDLFGFVSSNALGMNHPRLTEPAVAAEIGRIALHKPSNSDIYNVAMAEFVETFRRVLGDPRLPYHFFIEGGGLAIENALKAAFDYKSRLNEARGLSPELGTRVLHLRYAFHGRTGYTMSLTNTDPVKTARYPQFDWPRIVAPYLGPDDKGNPRPVEQLEALSLEGAEKAFASYGPDIAACIVEPIQSEGGDHHFRPEYLQALQRITHAHDALFIVDEVQTGVGMTGTAWAYQQLGLEPDIVAFGKKTQVCGIMAGGKLDEVPDNVFAVSGRLNSTWGGGLVDMVRAKHILAAIETDHLIEHAADLGTWLLGELVALAGRRPLLTNPRGRGLLAAFSLPDGATRRRFLDELLRRKVIMLGCGDRSVRFRPPLVITQEELGRGLAAIEESLQAIA